MSTPISDNNAPDILAAIAEAVSRLSPPSTVLALCFTANQNRLTSLHARLAAIDAEADELRVKRNAAARRLLVLAGKSRPSASAPDNTVAFPVFQKAAP